MSIPPQHRVPHLRDGFIVAKVGIERSETVVPLRTAETSKVEVD